MHHTAYGICMASVKLEEGETAGMKHFFREFSHLTEYGRRMSSVKTEVDETTGM